MKECQCHLRKANAFGQIVAEYNDAMIKKHFYYPIIDKRLADVRVPEDDLAIS